MTALTTVIALILVYFLSQEVVRRTHLYAMLAFFGLAPLALTGYWVQVNDFDPFVWIKIYSIMFCVCWGSWLRFGLPKVSPLLLKTVPLLLAGNILEAMLVDAITHGLVHQLNALSGAILIATLPYGAKQSSIDVASKRRDLHFDIPMQWIVGYTIWNWTFVYLNYPDMAGHHTAILAVALIVALYDPQRWVQTRAATLGLNLFLMATSNAGTLAVLDTSGWIAQPIAIGAALVVFGWMLVYLVTGFEWTKPNVIADVKRLADKARLPLATKDFVQSSAIQLETLTASFSLAESRLY